MKPVFRFVIVLGFVIFLGGCSPPSDNPITWHDSQGGKIVDILRSEFGLPIDSMTGLDSIGSSPWPYWSRGEHQRGSQIVIEGVEDVSVQNQIIARCNAIIAEQRMLDIVIEFREASDFIEKGSSLSRVSGALLRKERLGGRQ